MKAAGKKYEPMTYDGAGHGFMRAGEDPSNVVTGNKAAREEGFTRLVKLLHEMSAAPTASTGTSRPTSAKKSAPGAAICHDTSTASGSSM
jgi:carboxymethylenebutenolidase